MPNWIQGIQGIREVLNSVGAALTRRKQIQFAGALNASDDGSKTVVSVATAELRFDATQEILGIDPGDYTSASFGTTLAAINPTTINLHLSASSSGDIRIHGLPPDSGRRLVLKKRGVTGRIILVEQSGSEATLTARINTPASQDLVLSQNNDSLILENQFSRWRAQNIQAPLFNYDALVAGSWFQHDGSDWTVPAQTIRTGAGSPEGAITALVGSLFLRTDGGAGSTLYVKESGSSNTGWVAK